jgi:outer membrane receptor protein involved in Fe transport
LDWQSDGTLLLGAFSTLFGDFVIRSFTALDDRQKLTGNQLEAVLNFNTGPLRHQFLGGLEVSRLDDEFTLGGVEQLPPISLHSPQETVTNITTSLFLKNDARSVTLAPYLIDQITFLEKFQATIGGRFDAVDYKDAHLGGGSSIISSSKREYRKISPMLGLVFSPAQNLSLYANAGEAFGPPSTLVIENLKAEESKQIEAGVKTQFFNGKLHASLAAYQLDKNNLIIPDYTGFRYLSGEQRSRGAEIEIAAQPRHNWQTFIAYAFNEAELTQFTDQTPNGPVDRSGKTPAFAPKHIVNFWTNKTFGNRLGIGVGGRYLSEQFIDEDNKFKIDGFFTIDAMLYYQIGNWRWSINAKNLADTEYETRGYSSSSNLPETSGAVLPGNPAAIYGEIEFKL